MSESAQELIIDAPLADELERHGVHVATGDRLRFQLLHRSQEDGPLETQEVKLGRRWDAFVGRFESPEPDLARRAKEIARAEMGQ